MGEQHISLCTLQTLHASQLLTFSVHAPDAGLCMGRDSIYFLSPPLHALSMILLPGLCLLEVRAAQVANMLSLVAGQQLDASPGIYNSLHSLVIGG